MTSALEARPVGRRERLRADAVKQIKAAGREQLRTEGAAGLSLRAVARAVGMSSPGLYRYYASRDDLLTALIADAYDDLAACLRQARDAAAPELSVRLREVCLAYFDWAEANPAEWSLVFGAPVPGYAAPPDGDTTAAASRFGAVFLGLVSELWVLPGGVPDAPTVALSPDAVHVFDGLQTPGDPIFYGVSARLWCRLHGHIALGLFGHLFPRTIDPSAVRALYQSEVEDQLRLLGLG